MSPPHTTTIEILGAPAAGKSSLAQSLAAAVEGNVLKEHSWHDWPALASGLFPGSRTAWPVLTSRSPRTVAHARWCAWSLRLSGAPGVIRRHRRVAGAALVLDQGPVYTLGRMKSVRQTSRGRDWWEHRVDETAAVIDVVILLHADVEVLHRRLLGRAKDHRADVLGGDEAREYLESEQGLCWWLAGVMAREGVTVVSLDTGQWALGEQVEQVRSTVTTVSHRSEP